MNWNERIYKKGNTSFKSLLEFQMTLFWTTDDSENRFMQNLVDKRVHTCGNLKTKLLRII